MTEIDVKGILLKFKHPILLMKGHYLLSILTGKSIQDKSK